MHVHVLVICKFKKDQINIKRLMFETSILGHSGADRSVVNGENWPNFKLVQALTYVLVTASMKRIQSNTVEKMRRRPFTPLYGVETHLRDVFQVFAYKFSNEK